jgi:hypothetical protein
MVINWRDLPFALTALGFATAFIWGVALLG